ncbi:retrovirus-related pol polyprotein from transposon TNT 1-94 [Tanacetum coccineum]
MEYERRVNERQIQTPEEKTDMSNALDASLVIIEINGQNQKSKIQEADQGMMHIHYKLSAMEENLPCQYPHHMIAQGKTFASSTTRFESEPQMVSNEISITNGESEQALMSVEFMVSDQFCSGPMPQLMAPDHSNSGPVLHEIMSNHNSSDLASQRQEMSVENVSSGLVPQGQKASDYDNSDPVPPRQNVVPTAEKIDSSQQGLEFLFSPLLEDYYNPTHGLAEENNNNQAPNASFQEDEFVNPFYPEMCMFTLTVSIVEPKNIKEAMADSAWIEAMQDELHQFDRLNVWELVDKPFGKMVIKLKWLWKNKKDEDHSLDFMHHAATQVFSNLSEGRENGIHNGLPLKEEVYVAKPEGFIDPDIQKKSTFLRKALVPSNMDSGYPKESVFELNSIFRRLIIKKPDALILKKTLLEGYISYGEKFLAGFQGKTKRTGKVFSRGRVTWRLSCSCAQVKCVDEDTLKVYGFNYNKMTVVLRFHQQFSPKQSHAKPNSSLNKAHPYSLFRDCNPLFNSEERKTCSKDEVPTTVNKEMGKVRYCTFPDPVSEPEGFYPGHIHLVRRRTFKDGEGRYRVPTNQGHTAYMQFSMTHITVHESSSILLLKLTATLNIQAFKDQEKFGCEQSKGPHYTKDCPLKEEGKTLKEAYYTQFGGPFQGGGYRGAAPGFYQRNNVNPSYQERRQYMEDTLSKFMSKSAKRHEEKSNLIKEIRALMDAAIRNKRA